MTLTQLQTKINTFLQNGILPKIRAAKLNELFGDVANFADAQKDAANEYTDEAVATVTEALATKADLVAGKVPSTQLPSFVDDVVEVANFAALPGTGEAGKIYVTIDNNKTWRWTGSTYVEITDLSNYATTTYVDNKKSPYSISDNIPDADFDDSAGYLVGYVVKHQGTGIEYLCTDNSGAAAVWRKQVEFAYFDDAPILIDGDAISAETTAQYHIQGQWLTVQGKLTIVPDTGGITPSSNVSVRMALIFPLSTLQSNPFGSAHVASISDSEIIMTADIDTINSDYVAFRIENKGANAINNAVTISYLYSYLIATS